MDPLNELRRLSLVDKSMDHSVDTGFESFNSGIDSLNASSDDDEALASDSVLDRIKPGSESPPPERHDTPPDRVQVPSPTQKRPPSAEFQNYEHLLTELGLDSSENAPALVVLAPESYKHVFGRPWVSKSYLSSIVERPERLNAVALGVGACRSVCPVKVIESRQRTSLYSPHFEKVHGKDWATELYALCNQAASKHARGEPEVPDSWPAGDIYLTEGTLAALEGAIGAIECAVDNIYDDNVPARRAFVGIRPPGHHCHEDAASGFCIMNNAHIAIQYAHAQHGVTHAIILDFDLHHGDGSQDLLWKLGFRTDGPADIPMGYFSVHDINSFPCERGYADPDKLSAASVCLLAHDTAVWNVHLQPYATEAEFNRIYESRYSVLFQQASTFLSQCQADWESQHKAEPFKPLVVISAGFDGSEYEGQGMQRHKVHVPTSFFNRFTHDCVALANHYSDGHILSLLEGGYSTAAIATGVFSHVTALCELTPQPEWFTKDVAKELDRASRNRWKAVGKNSILWPTAELGIKLGRALFPIPDPKPEHNEPELEIPAYRMPRSNRTMAYDQPLSSS